MKLSIITSLFTIASASYLAAAEHSNLRGDSSRNLGLMDDLIEHFTGGKGDEKPTLPIDFDGSEGADLSDIIDNLDLGDFDLTEMMEKMQQLKEVLDNLDMTQIQTILSGLDLGNIDTGGLNLEDMLGNMEEIKNIMDGMDFAKIMEMMNNFSGGLDLPALLQNPELLESLLPMLGGVMESQSNCPSCDCEGIFAELDDECVSVQYVVKREDGSQQQRCLPKMLADVGVGLLQRYECVNA